MKDVLENMALLKAIDVCKEHKIDCSGTHIYKYPRRFTYALCKDETNRAVVTVTFYKNRTPSYFIHDNA